MPRQVQGGGRTVARRSRVPGLRAVARGTVPALSARAPVQACALGARRSLRLAAGEDRTWKKLKYIRSTNLNHEWLKIVKKN